MSHDLKDRPPESIQELLDSIKHHPAVKKDAEMRRLLQKCRNMCASAEWCPSCASKGVHSTSCIIWEIDRVLGNYTHGEGQ